MNTDNTRDGGGNRSLSLGAVLKEQRGLRTGVPEVEYEYGNGEYRSQNSDNADIAGLETPKRVVMMSDEHGNVRPMPMAGFYYDTVNVTTADVGDGEQERSEPTDSPSDGHDDTTRSNVPAPFKSAAVNHSSSSSSFKGDDDIDIDKKGGHNFVADDDEYDDLDEDEKETEDPFKNQFMRIEIAATGLKDVSRVKKDLDHDKPNKKNGIRAGLQRAVSTVKIAEGNRSQSLARTTSRSTKHQLTAKQLKSSDSNKSGIGLSRMLSLKKTQSVRSDHAMPVETSTTPVTDGQPTIEVSRGVQRPRESNAKPVRRQGLAAVGRMISINKQKAAPPTSASVDVSSSYGIVSPIADRASPSEGSDRPRSTATSSSSTSRPAGRSSLAQVGRLLSFNKKKQSAQSASRSGLDEEAGVRTGDRDRREADARKVSGARMGLAKLGRVMSFNRSKQVPDKGNDGSVGQASPISSSPVSGGFESPHTEGASSDRDRSSSVGTNSKKEPSRMKVAARMLSFSKKSGQNSRVGRTLLVAEDDKIGKGERGSQSGPRSESQEGGSAQMLDGRGDKFFYSEINSEKVRQCGLLTETHIRVPIIAMAEYSGPVSRNKWYVDGFSLPHNAVRRECIDLYDILTALGHCKGSTEICKDDIDDFEDWWNVASEFFNCYFDMERRVLFPWIDSAGAHDFEVQMALRKMRSMKDKLQEQLQKVDKLWNEKTFKEVGEMFALIYKAVDELVPRLMNYFADQEVLLPAIVKGYYRVEDRMKMDKDMVAAFMGEAGKRGKEGRNHNLILLIRWMGNPRQLRAWITKNLNNSARNMYGKWYSLYEEEHLRIVKQAKARARVASGK